MNDCQISRLTGVPLSTVQRWRVQGCNRVPGRGQLRASDCPFCASGQLDQEAYSYLLGLYLGDGCITRCPKDVYRLEIALDAKYPLIISECAAAISNQRQEGVMKVGVREYPTWVVLQAHWKHWPCLFPQHGRGKKHLRKIELRAWQNDIVAAYPQHLIRGLIHSDGCRFTNPVKRQWREGGPVKHYELSAIHVRQ